MLESLLGVILHGAKRPTQQSVPAVDWLSGRAVAMDIYVPGGLTYLDRARVANWFEVHIAKDQQMRHRWITSLPMAHAITVLLSYRLSKGEDESNDHLTFENLRTAWEHQKTATDKNGFRIDVDKECLRLLEERMFEQSFRAGIAGHRQWGLDAGDHQECWDPYTGRPDEWIRSDYQGDPKELLVRRTVNFASVLELMPPYQLGPKYVYILPPQDIKGDIGPTESSSQPTQRRRRGKTIRRRRKN